MHAVRNSLLTAAVIIFGLFTLYGVVGAAWAEAPTAISEVDNESFVVDVDEPVELDGADVREATAFENETVYNESTGDVVDEDHYEFDAENITITVTETCTSSGQAQNCVEDGDDARIDYAFEAPREAATTWFEPLETGINVLPASILVAGLTVVFGLVAFVTGVLPGVGGRNGRSR